MDHQVLSTLRRIEKRLERIEASLAKLKVPEHVPTAKRSPQRKTRTRRIRVPAHV